jgi:hypothetical protein
MDHALCYGVGEGEGVERPSRATESKGSKMVGKINIVNKKIFLRPQILNFRVEYK